MLIRLFAPVFGLLALACAASAAPDGRYNGVDASAGMTLQFSGSGGRRSGVLSDASGDSVSFTAEANDSGAHAKARFRGREMYLIFTDEPLGLSMVAIPLTGKDTVAPLETQAMIFLRDGVAVPPRPARYVEPPAGPGGNVDARAFVESYSFWPSQNVAWGYGMVSERYRTLIRLHPVVQTDILWKLCRSGVDRGLQGEALRGQAVSCDDVLASFGKMLRPGGSVAAFNKFRRDVETQKAELVEAIICSVEYRRNSPGCRRAGARVAEAAVSLVTVRSVLARY